MTPRDSTPSSHALTTVLADGFACTEAPRWRRGELYFSDMFGHAVMAVNEAGNVRTVARLDDVPVGLGWLPDERLLIVGQHERRVLRQEPDGRLAVHADLSHVAVSDLNDMCVDHLGRAYVGEVGFDSVDLEDDSVDALVRAARRHPGRIHLVRPDGTHTRLPNPVVFPNGMSISPDRDSLYVNASLESAVRRFDVIGDGRLGADTLHVAMDSPPDGMSDADVEGGHWVATPQTTSAIRVDADGKVTDRVRTDRMCLAVALGGFTGTTLFLCTTVSNDPDEALAQRRSRIETVTVRIPAA